ncbi:MAG: hypothetical protein KBT12_09080 [Bacteroidales bacterium]|nr:hypothetical protein [Candidatus Physcousia equi]
MTREVFAQLHQDACNEIVQHHLHSALDIIHHLVDEIHINHCSDELTRIERSYMAMLDFLSTGANDEGRLAMQEKMAQEAFILLNAVDAFYRVHGVNDFFAQCHSQSEKDAFLMVGKLLSEHEEQKLTPAFYALVSDKVFNTIVADFCLQRSDKEILTQLLQTKHENSFMQHLVQLVISALTLSLWEHFDPSKLELLLMATHHAHSLVGLAATLLRHHQAIRLWPQLEEDIRETLAQPDHQELMAHINREMLMSTKSEEIEKKVKEELLPKIMDAMSDERVRLGFMGDEEEEDDFERMMKKAQADNNPRVEKKKKDLMNAAMQFMNLHQEGVDINMDMFVNSMRLPFFRKLSNWFQPFFPEHPEIADFTYPNDKPNTLLKMLFEQGSICDIDRYALVLMIGQTMKSSPLASMLAQMENSAREAEAVLGSDFMRHHATPKDEVTSAVRTLYRFFTKSNWRSGTVNLFDCSLNFNQNTYLACAYRNNAEVLKRVGTVMAKYGKPSDALDYLKRYTELEGASVDTLQQMAYCQEREGNYRQAANLLAQADMLAPSDSHTLGLLLGCYTHLGMQENRLDCLEQLEQLLPTSTKITVETGLCLMKLERWKDAAQRFYKLELEEKKMVPSQRAIAWCSFKQRKYETALAYYQKLIDTPAVARHEDFLNAGHTAWLLGDTKRAISLYLLYITRYAREAKQPNDLLAPFDHDKAELMAHGIDANDIDLMHDIIEHKSKQA